MKKVALVILDGWGIAPPGPGNAVSLARTPVYDDLISRYPHATLSTSGEDVGLPEGQMGNSEVGHLNIGAGRIVWQELAIINKAVRENTIDNNAVLKHAFSKAKNENKKVHLIGLVSGGGVHSHHHHLMKFCSMAHQYNLENVFIHAFTDGRDTDPQSGLAYLQEVIQHAAATCGKLATITGRYYAMDRDKRWERVKIAYDALIHSKGIYTENWEAAVKESYANGVTDEFIKPIIITQHNKAVACIEENDIVICFNFRTDRCREITHVLTQQDMPEYDMQKLNIEYITMTRYDDTFKNVEVVFEKDNLSNTLGEVIASNNKTQLRIAETEKYPHVTFFFSGGRELPFENENRILIPSPKVATYDLQPEMSAVEVKDALLAEMKRSEPDFICINFANADMVGHTGVIPAAVKAIETVDKCLGEIIQEGLKRDYTFIIIADHGNAEYMLNPDGSPNTAHTTNPVPFILAGNELSYQITTGRLCDLAPTILHIMNISVPVEMNGKSLIA